MFSIINLPNDLLNNLLLGSTGKLHLINLAQTALVGAGQISGTDSRRLIELALDFSLAAWEANPFDGRLAGDIITLSRRLPYLNPSLSAVIDLVAANWRESNSISYLNRLWDKGDFAKVRHMIVREIAKEEGNLFWWQQALSLAIFEGDCEWTASMLPNSVPAPLEPLFAMVKADLALSLGDLEKAAHFYNLAQSLQTLPDLPFRQAECLLALNGLDPALHLFKAGLQRFPWQVNRLLRVYDIFKGFSKGIAELPGKVAIFLYSFNKCIELNETLKSLRSSVLSDFKIFVLNNGCQDDTAAILQRWQDDFGAERFAIITLPINVGAPAARNWLIHQKEVQNYPFIVFLDDDVTLPDKWLLRLGAARQAYPQAGVWGCQVVDFYRPTLLQSVDLHLLTQGDQPDKSPIIYKHFKSSDLHCQDLNFRQFDYLRPCVSVTGCCHLFDTGTLQESGDFDLSFSPSQFDDLDHDLRLALAGKPAVYNGHLTIYHRKRTGSLNELKTTPGVGANIYLLQNKYNPMLVRQIVDWERKILHDDLVTKMAVVQQELGYL